MNSLKGVAHLVLALALTTGLVGCGTPVTGSYSMRTSGSVTGISEQEALQIRSYNEGGALDRLPLEELEEEDFGESSEGYEEEEPTPDLFGSKSTTKIGYVRSVEDGKFYLQVNKGIFRKTELAFPLVASNEKMGMKLAKLLNKRVIVRGKFDKETITPTRAFRVPTLTVLTDLLKTGKIKGRIYDSRTMQTLDEAEVTARSLTNGRLYRVTSRRNGTFSLCRLAPGDYTLEVSLPGYARNGIAKITVQRFKVKEANVGLASGM